MQVEVINAKFKNGSHDYSFNPNGLELKVGDYVIVDTEKGREMACITKSKYMLDEKDLREPLKNVLEICDNEEVKLANENYKKAEGLYDEIKAIVYSENIDMKVINVECNYNFTRLTINFTADGRVDFRELVKRLADRFKVRIELRQIGPRDCTRILGGFGVCGKECCCHQGFGINDHVSIKMAKNQNLSLNPTNVSGLCGKLLCCLAFENPYYVETLKIMPKINEMVVTADGPGKVVYNNLLNKTVSVKFEDESSSEIKDYPLSEIKFKNSEVNDEK